VADTAQIAAQLAGLDARSRESEFLDRLERSTRRNLLVAAVVLVACAVALHTHPFGAHFVRATWLLAASAAVKLFADLIWTAAMPSARAALRHEPIDARIEITREYWGRGTYLATASVYPVDSGGLPLATLKWVVASTGRRAVARQSAQVYGLPSRRHVVVVSWPGGVLVGRVRRSRFTQADTDRWRAGNLAVAVVATLLAILSFGVCLAVLGAVALGDGTDPAGSAFGACIVASFGGVMLWLARNRRSVRSAIALAARTADEPGTLAAPRCTE
jgi:hypothetical protein